MNRLITFFVCFALFFRLFNPIHAFISGGETFAMLIPVILIFVADTMYLRKSSYYLISVILIIAFLNLIKVDYFSNFIPRCVEMSFAFFGLEHYLITGDRTYAKSVLYTSYATLAFLIIFSIPQFILIPNLSRLLQSREENADIDFSYYWTISYVFIHHLTIFQIPLYAIYQFTEKKLYKILSSVGIFVILLLLIFADATTPLLMSFFTLIFFLLYKGSMSFSSQLWKFIVLGAFFFLFTSSTVIVSSLRFVQPIFQDSSNYKKIDEIILYLTNNETSGDLEQRGDLYQISLNSFMENPFFPETRENINYRVIGLHSAFLDHLVAMGLFLFIPFLVLIYDRYSNSSQYLSNYLPYHLVSYFIFVSMGCLKNFMLFVAAWFIVPLFLIYLETDEEENEEIEETMDRGKDDSELLCQVVS